MQFLSCFSTPCQTIVAIVAGRLVSVCPTCGRPLLLSEASSGPPMGFAKRETETIVKEHGGAYWRVAVRCVER